jgi:hypothetical protein
VGGPHVEVMSVRDERRDGVVVIGCRPHDHGSVACGDSLMMHGFMVQEQRQVMGDGVVVSKII